MRILFGLLLVAAVCCVAAPHVAAQNPETGEVLFVDNPAPGVVTVQATGYGKKIADAEKDAYETAFNTILFRGLPGFGGLRLPMVENESQSKADHAEFYRKFFAGRDYMRFVTDQTPAAKAGKGEKKRVMKVQKNLSINYDALRRHLEQEGIIRKFGY